MNFNMMIHIVILIMIRMMRIMILLKMVVIMVMIMVNVMLRVLLPLIRKVITTTTIIIMDPCYSYPEEMLHFPFMIYAAALVKTITTKMVVPKKTTNNHPQVQVNLSIMEHCIPVYVIIVMMNYSMSH